MEMCGVGLVMVVLKRRSLYVRFQNNHISQLARPQSSKPLDPSAFDIFAVINVCVNGSDAYVQLTNCFTRLWSQFSDLLALYIVCGGCQPNSLYKVRIAWQLISEEIQRPRNRELGLCLLSGQLTPLPTSRRMHRGMAAYSRRNPPHVHPLYPSLCGLGLGLLKLFDRFISPAYCRRTPFPPV